MKKFLDVGANVGQTLDRLVAEKWDGHVVCFEPSPRHLSALWDKVRACRDHHFKCHLVAAAVSGTTGMVTFHSKTSLLADSIDGAWRFNLDADPVTEVCSIRLSDYIRLTTSRDDELTVKLDCEGSEYSILNDLLNNYDLLPRIKRIMVEWHDSATNKLVCADPWLLLRFEKTSGIKLEEWRDDGPITRSA